MAQYKGAASEAGRAMHLMKKREKQREQMEQMKQRIAEENIMKSNIDKKFSAHYDAVEAELKSSTVGLVTLNDMKAKQEALVKEREKQLAKKEQSKELQLKLEKLREKERKKEAKRKISSLSFTLEEEEEGGEEEEEVALYEEELEREEITTKKRKLGKNPDVDTSFLPDRDREEEENRLREELRQEWEAKQEKIKSEEIEITFSYWDGSGHRRTVKMKKGNTMQQFLQKALEILRKDFSELRSAGVEQLMYIKEDLIIPHHHSFYDFIVTKARGKSGPLFNFDVHDDVRLLSDATVEKDESHAGKVVLRSWYEKNKHIFPASRWEPYDPEKKWDKYTEPWRGGVVLWANALQPFVKPPEKCLWGKRPPSYFILCPGGQGPAQCVGGGGARAGCGARGEAAGARKRGQCGERERVHVAGGLPPGASGGGGTAEDLEVAARAYAKRGSEPC
ncbi:protein FAM50A [Ctenodactylus gundi]